jgi:hypothetical protein
VDEADDFGDAAGENDLPAPRREDDADADADAPPPRRPHSAFTTAAQLAAPAGGGKWAAFAGAEEEEEW